MTSTRDIIESHWKTANARDWPTFGALLHPELRYEVPQTREYIDSAVGYLDLFRTWPGMWLAHIRELVCEGDRATCRFDFRCDGETVPGISFFRVEDGRIREVTDYWPEPYDPPPRVTPHMKRHGVETAAVKKERPEPVEASRVQLREVTADTVRKVVNLAVSPMQRGFVATNAISLAQALFAKDAWYRAIYVDDEPAGFVMLEDQSLREPPPDKPEIGVWRFMVDERFQGRGIGDAALRLVIDHARAKGFDKLLLSYMPGPGCPEPFYRRLGFVPNGQVDGAEVVMELAL